MGQQDLLNLLKIHKAGLTVKEAAQLLSQGQSSINMCLGKLVKAGEVILLTKPTNEKYKRVSYVYKLK